MAEASRAGPHGYVHGWIYVAGVMNPDHLKPTANVPRDYTTEELAQNIKKNGLTAPVRVRHERGTTWVIDGHHRLKAAKLAGLTSVPVLMRHPAGEKPPPSFRQTRVSSEEEYYAMHAARSSAVDERAFHAALRAAGMLTNPSGTERLHQYWVHGEGAGKIRWGEPGDFDRCVRHLSKYIRDPKGYCNLAHHSALGIYPATHAAMEHKAGRSAPVADKKPYGDVKYADPKNGKYPLDTEKHIRAAWSYINQADNAAKYPMNGVTLAEVKARIKAAMDKLGADTSSSNGSGGGGASRSEFMRMYPLENIEILRSEKNADGHEAVVVEAYAAVFGQAAEIKDHEGHYIEEIDRAAFDTAIAFAARQPGGFAANIKVLYNHGLTVQGTPAPEFQLPIGVPVDIKPEERGLLTRTQYDYEDQFVQRLLGKIRQGSISAQSFVGRIIRSEPQLSRGDQYRPGRTGELRTVRRMKLGLREYGPVLWPAYSGAEILGVRMSTPGGAPDPGEEFDDAMALPPDEGPAFTGNDPLPEEHSARYHQHQLYVLRSKELREKHGLTW